MIEMKKFIEMDDLADKDFFYYMTESEYTSTGNISSCFFYLEGFN